MADDPGKTTQTNPPSPPAAEPEEQRFDAAYLTEMSRALLGVPGAIAAGALAADSSRKTWTVDQAKELVKNHGKRKVEFDTTDAAEDDA